MKSTYSLAELEAAINYWRLRHPSRGDELALCEQAGALAEPYALMIYEARTDTPAQTLSATALQALKEWESATKSA